jgi:hypothetical protein
MSIYKKLLKIQQQVSGLGKDKDGHGYRYVTGDKVLSHIKPLMNEHGLLLKQEVLSVENTRQDYYVVAYSGDKKDKFEILSKVMMRFTWIDTETGEKDENLFGANGQNSWDKGVGSALTYGERYFLLKYFHIATDEDDIDNPERKKEEAPKAVGKQEGHKLGEPSDLEQRFMNLVTKEKALTDNVKKGVTYSFKTHGWTADVIFNLIEKTGVKTIKKADIENLCK